MNTSVTNHCLVGGILLLHAGLLAWAAGRHSPSIDEVGHMPAGLSHWDLGRFEMYRVNPPLVRLVATAPVALAGPKTDWSRLEQGRYHKLLEFSTGRQFIADNGEKSFWYFTLARWACIPFSLLGGYVCYRWGRELYGYRAGLLALILWCSSPNILGNAQMITPDTGAAALGLAAGYLFWRWLRVPGWPRAVAAGIVLGLAQLTKATWVVLFGLWPILWLFWRLSRRETSPTRPGRPGVDQLLLILFLGLYVLNLGYGLEGTLEPLGNYDFVSEALAGPTYPPPRGTNRFLGTWAEDVPVPFPRNYVLGIDEQKRDFERTMYSYLRGEWRRGGWWYYYLYGLLIKVPLGTWLLVLLAAAVILAKRDARAAWRDELVLLAPALAVLTLVSSQTGFNHHLRYVLPALPFAFIWVSKVAGPHRFRGWLFAVLVIAALSWSGFSSLRVYPHSLSYFNEAVGGPRGGHAHLVDSNIDWGQDLLHLKWWLEEHPEARPLGLAYFGQVDPRVAGIEFTLPPKGPVEANGRPSPTDDPVGPLPGWYAVSVTILRGYRYTLPDGRGGYAYTDRPYYRYFLEFEPVATAGYSIYIYHLTGEDCNRFRERAGLPLLK